MTYGRYNPRITFDQYVMLMKLREATELERGTFQKLVREWGVPQSTLSTAVNRGIKTYEYKLWKQGAEMCASGIAARSKELNSGKEMTLLAGTP
jgi:hypothetical protein